MCHIVTSNNDWVGWNDSVSCTQVIDPRRRMCILMLEGCQATIFEAFVHKNRAEGWRERFAEVLDRGTGEVRAQASVKWYA